MTVITNAVGFCLLNWLITGLFSPAHTEARKTPDTTAMAVNIPRGFRSLQGSHTRHVRVWGISTKLLQYNWSTGRNVCLVIGSTKWLDVVATMTWLTSDCSHKDKTGIGTQNNIFAYLDVNVRNNSTSFDTNKKKVWICKITHPCSQLCCVL